MLVVDWPLFVAVCRYLVAVCSFGVCYLLCCLTSAVSWLLCVGCCSCVRSVLLAACWFLVFAVRCPLCVARCVLFVAWCAMFACCCLLCVETRALRVVRCWLIVARCLLLIDYCFLFAVCR